MKNLSNILGVGLLAIAAIFMAVMFAYFFSANPKLNPLADPQVSSAVDVGLYTSYVYSFIVMVAIGFALIFGALTNPGGFLRSILSSVIIIVIFFICYSVSSNEVTDIYKKFSITPFMSQFIGGGLILSFIMSLASVLVILFSEVVSLIRN